MLGEVQAPLARQYAEVNCRICNLTLADLRESTRWEGEERLRRVERYLHSALATLPTFVVRGHHGLCRRASIWAYSLCTFLVLHLSLSLIPSLSAKLYVSSPHSKQA